MSERVIKGSTNYPTSTVADVTENIEESDDSPEE